MSNEKENSFDLGTGSIFSLFKKFWIPSMISVLIGGTFVVFDTMFVSHGFHAGGISNDGVWYWVSRTSDLASYASNGATGLSYVMPYTLIMVASALMIGGGLARVITNAKAKKDKEGEKRGINSHFAISIYVGLVITIFILIFSKVLIWMGSGFQKTFLDNWFNNPLTNKNWENEFATESLTGVYDTSVGHLLSQASWYLRIQGLAAIPYVYMYSSTLILRTEGKTPVATKVNLVALGLNIIFDFLLVIVFGMNLVGAAIATVIAQITGMAIYLWYFKNKFPNKVTGIDWKGARKDTKLVLKKGTGNLGMQLNSALMIIFFTISIGFINYGDIKIIISYGSAFQSFIGIYLLTTMIVNSIVISTEPIINYNNDIQQFDRSKKAKKIGIWGIVIVGVVFTMIIMLFPLIVTHIFISIPEAEGYTQRISQILVLGFTFNGLIIFAGVYFQAVGEDWKSTLVIYSKPLLLLPVILIIGFATKSTDSLSAWSNSILPWNSDLISFGQPVSLGLFWGLPVTDVIIGMIAIWFIVKDNKKQHVSNLKENF